MSDMADSQPRVLALVRDLMFVSKIAAAAKSVGTDVQVIRNPVDLGTQSAELLLVDLNLAGAIEAAREWIIQTSARAIGFVSHTDTGAIEQGRQAGFDRILARSAFVQLLPDILRGEPAKVTDPPHVEP